MSTLAMRALRVVVLLTLLGGSLGGAGLAAAQDSGLVGDDGYVSPKFGFEVGWGGAWEYLDGSEDESDDQRDHIDLVNPDLQATLHITAFSDVIDPAVELTSVVDNSREQMDASGEEFELLGQTEGDGYVAAAMEYTIDGELDRQYVEIASMDDRVGERGTLALQLMSVKTTSPEAFADVVDNVALDGDPILQGDLEETIGTGLDDESAGGDAQRPDGLVGHVYGDVEHGIVVDWDDQVWDAEELSSSAGAGVILTQRVDGGTSLAQIDVREGVGDAETCQADVADGLSLDDTLTDFAPARRVDSPDTDRDAVGAVYTYTYEASNGTPLDLVSYVECRVTDDGAGVVVQVIADPDTYDAELDAYSALLAGISIVAQAADDEDTPEADDETPVADVEIPDGLDGDTYGNADAGLLVEWDDREWAVEELDQGVGIFISRDVEGAISIGQIEVRDNVDASDVDDCAAEFGDELETLDGISDVSTSRTLDAPETHRDAAGTVYEYTFTTDDGTELPLVSYLECRALADGSALRVEFTADADSYEDQVGDFGDFLAGIQIVDAGAASDDEDTPEADDETPTSDDEPRENDPDAGEIDGDTFTDTALGYTATWDDTEWTGELAAHPGLAGVVLSTADPDAPYLIQVIIDASTGYAGMTPEECVEDLADLTSQSEGYEDWVEAPRVDGPQPPRDGAATTYSYTYSQPGEVDLAFVSYIECRPVDDDVMVRASVITTQTWLEDQVALVQDVLDGIDVGSTADGPADDEDTPEADDETPEAGDALNDVAAGEIDGDTFTDTALGYSFSWDDRTWEATALEDGATAGVFLRTDDQSLFATVTVDGSLGYEGIDAEQCVSDYADSLGAIDGYSTLRVVRTVDGPEPPRGGANAVFSYTYTYGDGTTADFVASIQCRPISDEAMVRINIQTTPQSLDTNADAFQELLDGIDIDAGTATDDPADEDNLGPTDETPTTDDDAG